MIDKIKHHRAYVSFLKFLKLLMIPTMQEIGGISKGHILTAYQNGSVNVSKLKIPINSKHQKEVAINTGRCITILIIPWTRNEFLLSFIFSQISYTMCAYFSSYICNVGQFVKFLFTVLFYRQFRPRRLLPSRLRRATASACGWHLGGRLFVCTIITQIGRENKFSAEIFACQFSVKNAERIGWPYFSVRQRLSFVVVRVVGVRGQPKRGGRSRPLGWFI